MTTLLKKIRARAGNGIQTVLSSAGWELRRRSERHTTPMTLEALSGFLYFVRRFAEIRLLQGDIVECGVGRGKSFLCLAFLAAEENAGRMLWGFDSFAGFPDPTPEDKSPRNPQQGEKISKKEDVVWMLRDAHLGDDFVKNYVRFVPGFFNDTLPHYTGNNIALLHIDGDLYRSYKDTLDTLYSRVVPGGLILFDEYNTVQFPGATKAVNEFFSGKGVEIKHDRLSEKYYCVKPQ
ncbi:MAG: hypothetical protein G01um101433_333 [Parcubacteria group bacterium Gr01-1014_33]|nr:MAG: hypothetical protein G01um101433_333 [Parcubacteria group bacterium Gr01-1014_33]